MELKEGREIVGLWVCLWVSDRVAERLYCIFSLSRQIGHNLWG